MNAPYDVARVLADTGPILLDFDGPVCGIFATIPDYTVAARLRQVLALHGTEIPERIQSASDPLEVLRFTASLGDRSLIARVDDELRQAELAAVRGASPTPYAREVIVAAHQAGRPVAIVSNNSATAVQWYLNDHRLSRYVRPVVGRAHADPERMKPNPEPILCAVNALRVKPTVCVLIGDSASDIEGGRAAGVRTIAFANKPGKRNHLVRAGADAATEGATGMAQIAAALIMNDMSD